MIVLVTGGAKNGKSTYSEDLIVSLSKNNKRYYVATMVPYDEEDHNRIKVHRENRKNKGFETVELKTNINSLVDNYENNSFFLLDSLTALVLNEVFEYENKISLVELEEKLKNDFDILFSKIKNIVIVSDYIFSNLEPFSDFTNDYLKLFGHLSCFLASKADVVIENVCGRQIFHKGEIL